MPTIRVGSYNGQSPIVIMPSAGGFVETFQPHWFREVAHNGGRQGTSAGAPWNEEPRDSRRLYDFFVTVITSLPTTRH